MIYLQQFNTTAEYNSAILPPPNVAWDKESGEIHYVLNNNESLNLIHFTYEDVEYTAIEGMTISDWQSSEYNTISAQCYEWCTGATKIGPGIFDIDMVLPERIILDGDIFWHASRYYQGQQ